MKHLVLALMIVWVAPACKKAKDMASYKARAAALTAKFAPKLADLSKDLPDLAAKTKDLPVNVPGVDKLGKLITENKSALASAQDLLKSLPDKLGTETPDQAQKDLDDAEKTLDKDVKTAEDDEKEEATEIAQIKAAAPAAGGAK